MKRFLIALFLFAPLALQGQTVLHYPGSVTFVPGSGGDVSTIAPSTLVNWHNVKTEYGNQYTGTGEQTYKGTENANGMHLPAMAPLWFSTTWQSYEKYVDVIDSNGNIEQLTTTGTTGGTQPTWAVTLGATTNDGSCVWTLVATGSYTVHDLIISSGWDTFTSADVGKDILISGASNNDIDDIWTTITGYVSSTEVTVSASAPTRGYEHISESYWFNSAQNDTAFIQDAINAGGTVYLPKGVYVLGTQTSGDALTYSQNLRAIRGDGSGETVILDNNMPGTWSARNFHFTDAHDLLLQGFSVRGPGINNVYGGELSFDLKNNANIENVVMRDVQVRQTASANAIAFQTPILCKFQNVKSELNVGNGLRINGGVADDIDNSYFITDTSSGLDLKNSYAIHVHGGAEESSGIGYVLTNCTACSLDTLDAESQVQRAALAPTSAPAVTAGGTGGGIPTGTYYLKYTWISAYNANAIGIDFQESLPSPETSQLSVTLGQEITVPIPAAPSDGINVNYVGIYMTPTNGASGSEVIELYAPIPGGGAGGNLYLSGYTETAGVTPPIVSGIGHAIVLDGSHHTTIGPITSNGVPITAARHLLILGDSDDTLVKAFNVIEGSTNPTYDFEVDSGSSNTIFETDNPPQGIDDLGTATVQLKGGVLTWPGTLNSTGAVSVNAGGTNQNVTITPSGTGYTILNGNVGIGRAGPLGALDVSATPWVYFRNDVGLAGQANPSASAQSGMEFGWNPSNSAGESQILYNTVLGSGPQLDFGRWDGTTKTIDMTLKGGNVGIGTASPSRLLSLQAGGAGTNTYLSFNAGGAEKMVIGDEESVSPRRPFVVYDTSAGAYRMVIDASGNVGIGTTNPQATLDVAGQDRRDPVAFSTLTACSSTIEGETAAITDSTTNTWGATITGSGSDHVLGYCNGSSWVVAAP